MSIGFGINYEPKLNFKDIFSNPQFTVYDLLAADEIIKQVKASIKIFTKELVKKQFLVKDLIDIIIRPQFLKQNGKDIPIIYPFLAIEILCSQQDQFYSYLFRHGYNRTLSFPKINQQSEYSKAPVMYIFEVLQTNNRINDTAAGYLAKFIEQITVYQKGTELFQLLKKNEKIYGLLFQHCYCTSMMEIIKHLLFIENQEISERKEQLIERLFGSLLEEKRPKELTQKLDNLVGIIQELIEKYNEKSQYQRKKFFFELLKFIICNKNVYTIKLMIQKFKDNQEIVSSGLDILLKFLKFQKLEKKKEQQRNKNLKIIVQKHYSEFQILQQFQKVVEFLLFNLYLNMAIQSSNKIPPNVSNKIKISTMKLFFLIQQILNLNQRFSSVFMSTRFIKLNVKLFKQFPFNNFLHNSQKEIIILSLQTERAIDICYKEAGLIDFIIQCFINPQNKKIGFINQLFHIIKAIEIVRSKRSTINLILTQYPRWEQILLKNFQKMKSQYQRFLGGQNPKAEEQLIKLNWQNLKTDKLQNGQDTPAFIPNNVVHLSNQNENSNISSQNKSQSKMQDLDFSTLKDEYDQYQENDYDDEEQEDYSPGEKRDNKQQEKSKCQESKQSHLFSQPKVENISNIQMKGLEFDQYEQQQQDPDDDCYIQDEPMSVGRNKSNRW